MHVVRQWLARYRNDPNKILVTVDVENAFDSVDRSAFLSEVRRVMPGLTPWIDYCYASQVIFYWGRAFFRVAVVFSKGTH